MESMSEPLNTRAGSGLRYAVITMVRNEEDYLPRTVASMISQTERPVAWFVVDDGSEDATPEILAKAAADHDWIKVQRSPGRERRNPAEAVTEGFNRVLPLVWELNPDAVVKLDGDMEFAPDYFTRLLTALAEDPRLGIVGGRALEPHADGSWGLVRISRHHVHGATHVFRAECLRQQNGFSFGAGWDTATVVRARLAGWTTRSLPDVAFKHLRVTGAGSGLRWGFWSRGRAAYRAGYHPLFAVARSVRNLVRYPYIVSGFYFFLGFISGYRDRAPRALTDPEIRAFRREQMKTLIGRKSWWR